jgi:hypothetical protein
MSLTVGIGPLAKPGKGQLNVDIRGAEASALRA